MSVQQIHQYHANVERVIRYSGSRNESALRKCFHDLLRRVCTVSVETMAIVGQMPASTPPEHA